MTLATTGVSLHDMIGHPYHKAGIVKTVFLMGVYGVLLSYAGFAIVSWVVGVGGWRSGGVFRIVKGTDLLRGKWGRRGGEVRGARESKALWEE